MYQPTFLFLLSLLSLHLTNKCWAQEPTTTIATTETTTTTPTSEFIVIHPTTINPFADNNNNTTTYVTPEGSTTLLAPPSDPTTTINDSAAPPESTTDGISDSATFSSSETTPAPPMATTDFTTFASLDVVRDCGDLTVWWAGTGIAAPYSVTWSTGTGDRGNSSMLGEETSLGSVCEHYIQWQAPTILKVPHGNWVRFTIKEKYGQVATIWAVWESADFQECIPFLRGTPDKSCLPASSSMPPLTPTNDSTGFPSMDWPTVGFPSANTMDQTDSDNGLTHAPTIVMAPTIGLAPTTQMVTLTLTVPVEQTPNSPAAMPVPPEMVTLTLTVPAGPNPTPNPSPTPTPNSPSSPNATPNPVTVAVGEPSVVAVPIEGNNSPSPPRNNMPRPSGVIDPPFNSPPSNSPQPSGSAGGNSQGSNDDTGIHANQFLRTLVVPIGDSTTLTIITEIPHPTESTRDNVGVQQSLTPATTAVDGQKNTTKRTGLPPVAIGVIIGTILGGITLWVLLLIWLKRRKRAARRFDELEDPVSFAPAEEIKVTPYTAPAQTPSSLNTNPNPKRIIQEIIRSDSPVTSIGETGTYSGLYNLPISDTQSQEPSCSEASTSKPLTGQAKLYKSPRGSMI